MTKRVDLNKDCEAVQVPAGNRVVLPAGTPVEILEELGGVVTVEALGGRFTIAGQGVAALGDPPGAGAASVAPAATEPGRVDEQIVWAALRECYDPELPVNIVDLGLVYDLAVDALPVGGGYAVTVKMTLTTPGCSMGPLIARDAEAKLLTIPGVRLSRVELVWDPPWHPSMISAEGKRILGM
ncbi:MAG TPA: iron-sulfur cluster assembly protein [Verrucomicrobiota bacterium]|nr:iron-sulfur cluster assembly protein [Verrucomicrobiota bacterium]HNU52248.1 iron-sulfur cluster assembly protein [Verrucomicrobiota bacterium]